MSKDSNKRQKIIRRTIGIADGLSFGTPMVVAILIGIGTRYLLKEFTPYPWLLWLGVFWGVAAAILDVYKTYKSQVESYGELQQRDELIEEKIRQRKQDNGK